MAKTTDIAPDDIAPGKPLHGLTIVELGHSVAAPYAGLILVELGARVIKVENPQGGDYARGGGRRSGGMSPRPSSASTAASRASRLITPAPMTCAPCAR